MTSRNGFVEPPENYSNSRSEQVTPVSHLLRSIENNPRYKDLVQEARRTEGKYSSKRPQKQSRSLVKKLEKLGILVDPKDLHGNSVVTENLDRAAKNTAKVMSVSAIINGAFVLPPLYYAFSFLGPPLSLGASFLASWGVAAFSNQTATLTTSRNKENSLIPAVAGLGFLGIASTLTIASAVGAELFNNQSQLSQIVASEQADQYIQKTEESLENIPFLSKLESVSNQCEKNERELAQLPEGSIQRDDLFRRTWGSWAAYDEYFLSALDNNEYVKDIDTESALNKPICVQAMVYQRNVDSIVRDREEQVDKLKTTRNSLGSDVDFLKAEAENIYEQFFTPQGYLKDGALAVRIALHNLVSKTSEGRWSELGFSVFLFLISAITSATACFLAFSLASLKDSELSTCPIIRKEIIDFLQELESDLYLAQDYEKARLKHGFANENSHADDQNDIEDNENV